MHLSLSWMMNGALHRISLPLRISKDGLTILLTLVISILTLVIRTLKRGLMELFHAYPKLTLLLLFRPLHRVLIVNRI